MSGRILRTGSSWLGLSPDVVDNSVSEFGKTSAGQRQFWAGRRWLFFHQLQGFAGQPAPAVETEHQQGNPNAGKGDQAMYVEGFVVYPHRRHQH